MRTRGDAAVHAGDAEAAEGPTVLTDRHTTSEPRGLRPETYSRTWVIGSFGGIPMIGDAAMSC